MLGNRLEPCLPCWSSTMRACRDHWEAGFVVKGWHWTTSRHHSRHILPWPPSITIIAIWIILVTTIGTPVKHADTPTVETAWSWCASSRWHWIFSPASRGRSWLQMLLPIQQQSLHVAGPSSGRFVWKLVLSPMWILNLIQTSDFTYQQSTSRVSFRLFLEWEMVDDGGISLDFLRKGKESLPKKDVTCSIQQTPYWVRAF